MKQIWRCSKGHELEVNDDISKLEISILRSPKPITFNFGKGVEVENMCPYCILEWIYGQFPRMELIKEEDG